MRRADLREWMAGTKVTASARLVFMVLALYDREGCAWPSVETLARVSGLSGRTVQRALRELEGFGEVAAQIRTGRTSLYQLDPRHSDTPTPDTVTPRGVTSTTERGDIYDQNPRHGDTQKELKELKDVVDDDLPPRNGAVVDEDAAPPRERNLAAIKIARAQLRANRDPGAGDPC